MAHGFLAEGGRDIFSQKLRQLVGDAGPVRSGFLLRQRFILLVFVFDAVADRHELVPLLVALAVCNFSLVDEAGAETPDQFFADILHVFAFRLDIYFKCLPDQTALQNDYFCRDQPSMGRFIYG